MQLGKLVRISKSPSNNNLKNNNPADTDVFKTSSRRLKKVATSCDQTRRRHDVWKKTSHLRRLEDV